MESNTKSSDHHRTPLTPEEIAKTGVIYLSTIPTGMTVKHLRHIMSRYGKVGRIFLQPHEKQPRGARMRSFKEGWIEFFNKKKAKLVVLTLNNTQIGGKRKNPWYNEFWCLKYLSKFKWTHLNERLEYERATHQQRMRVQISQAKREADFYIKNVELKARTSRKAKSKALTNGQDPPSSSEKVWKFEQKKTDQQILSEKSSCTLKTSMKPPAANRPNCISKRLFSRIFSGGVKVDS